MNQPTSDRPMVSPDQITVPATASQPMLPIDPLDACGSGYTAGDLARVLAARDRATASTEAACSGRRRDLSPGW
jgi:hypothetical protein